MKKVWAYRCRLCSEKEICKVPMILFQSMKRAADVLNFAVERVFAATRFKVRFIHKPYTESYK